MKTSLRKAVLWVLPVGLALFSQAALALGLGNVKVESYLNQPLRARIDLLASPDEDLSKIGAALAPAEDFALIGASREAISVPLTFSVDPGDGNPRVVVTSDLPIKDPIVRLIVELTWPNGRMLREYTLFLDPATTPATAPPPVVDQRGGRAAPPVQPAATRHGEAAASPARQQASRVPEAGEYGPVQGGETLWRIASDWSRGTGLDVNQVMLAIQRNNPQAFINDNINLLKRGAILRMPRADDVASISPAAARAAVMEQDAALGRAAPPPVAAVDTPLVADVSEAAEPAAEAGEAEPEAQLEIVPPAESAGEDSASGTAADAPGAETSTSTAALREELARAEEELIGQRQENTFLKERIADLESRLEAAGEGTVTEPDLAAMSERLREQREGGEAPADSTGAAAQTEAPQPAAPSPTVPRVQSPPPPETPWYGHVTLWVIVVLVLGAAAAGWIMSRREPGGGLWSALGRSEEETVRGIKGEAEEILKVLEPGVPTAAPAPVEAAAEAETATETGGETEAEAGSTLPEPDREEAELLDEDSEDPEVRLDLARAYIAMGDREAARVILDEVIQHGNQAQQAEARSMLTELR